MKIAVLSIGDELLKGFTVNTNLSHLGQALLEVGVMPFEAITIPDERPVIVEHIRRLLPLADHLILTGGLGPTADDLTREAVADALDLPLVRDPEIATFLQERWFSRFGGEVPLSNLKQADCIQGAVMLENPNGTAPGQCVEVNGKTLWLLPGPPSEMLPMMRCHLIPTLEKTVHGRMIHRCFPLCGVPESEVELRAVAALEGLDIHIAYCAETNFVKVYLAAEQHLVMERAISLLESAFGNAHVEELHLPEAVLNLLRSEKATLAAAESCTGGLLAATLTDIPGSSDVFLGSAVTYANTVKAEMLGVDQDIIETDGAVSESCCMAMLYGVEKRFASDAAIAITGIAGPNGGTPEKPVGTVYIGWAWRGRREVRCFHFIGDRARIRQRTVGTALEHLRHMILVEGGGK